MIDEYRWKMTVTLTELVGSVYLGWPVCIWLATRVNDISTVYPEHNLNSDYLCIQMATLKLSSVSRGGKNV